MRQIIINNKKKTENYLAYLDKCDHMTWIENEYKLSSGQFVADLDAPYNAQTCQEQLATEPLAQLQVRLVVAHRTRPRIIQLKQERCSYNKNALEYHMTCWQIA